MRLHTIFRSLFFAAGLFAHFSPFIRTASGEALPKPAAAPAAVLSAMPSAIPRNDLSLEQTAEQVSLSETRWRKRWALSLAPLVASQSLDAASSYGMRELNPLLASPNGGFGAKAVGIKFGAVSGFIGMEYLLVKKFPRSAKFFSIVNWSTAGITTGFAVHNYAIR